MTDDDYGHFMQSIRHFAVVHKQVPSNELLFAYWEDLKQMARVEFDRVATILRKTSKWMPKPAEFWKESRRGWT